MLRSIVIGFTVVAAAGAATATTIPGGGSKRNDCAVTLQSDGLAFPVGKSTKGATCADGGPCDADGIVDGGCDLLVAFCTNVESEALPECGPSDVNSLTVTGGKLKGGGSLDLTDLEDAASSLALPTSEMVCSRPATVRVPVRGPDSKGELSSGSATIKTTAETSRGKDKDQFKLVCRPSSGVPTTSSTAPVSTTTTSTTSTTTSTAPPPGPPGAGLQFAFVGTPGIDAAGVVKVTFSLTDDAGVPITPQSAAVNPPDPSKARVRFSLARLEVNAETSLVTTTFTRWQNYRLNATGMPAYDAGGATAFVPGNTPGEWVYTFTTVLPAGYDATLTHRIGGQVQRTYQDEALVANPIVDWVPAGGDVMTERDVTSTAQCNQCHNPLQAHGGGRREVKLCQTCHTDQWKDPDTGFAIDFKNMIHRIHTGKNLPSVTGGAVGASYGFGNTLFGEKVAACVDGALAGLPCTSDTDCPGGTCTGATTVGVGFPKDIRNCTTCHTVTPQSEEADNFKTLPSSNACTGCHDDVNPSEVATDAGAPGTNHPAGDQPDADCRVCHKSEGAEFDDSVPGAHVVPGRSDQLAGLVATIQSVQGTPGGTLSIDFRVVDDAGAAVNITGFNRVAFATSGPTTDFGGASSPLVQQTMVGGGSGGVLTGPDGSGNYSYTSTVMLPADAEGTWRLGLEMRNPVTLSDGTVVNEAAQNPVAIFSVDGSPPEDRREVVDIANCSVCHGTFSVDFSIHGNLRNQTDYCVICHNANVTDFDRRRRATGVGADPVDETITFKHLIHKIHRGEELEHHPYVVYGFGAAPANFTAHDFSEVLFPGDLRDCDTCHVGGSQLLPLPDGLLPTRRSVVDTSGGPAVETTTGSTPPIQDACLACHDADDAAAHAETMTTGAGAEACNVCHEEGAIVAVSEVHAR